MATKNVNCPKCRQKPTGYDEVWAGHWIQFSVDASGVPERVGEIMPGDPVGVKAICSCGYSWRLRGITSVAELRN